jgi:hypothetical protein
MVRFERAEDYQTLIVSRGAWVVARSLFPAERCVLCVAVAGEMVFLILVWLIGAWLVPAANHGLIR